VLDGQEGKQYDSVGADTLVFSPDSQHVAYTALITTGTVEITNKWLVVVDEEEGKQYDQIISRGGRGVIFDSNESLHYLALDGINIYLVEEKMR